MPPAWLEAHGFTREDIAEWHPLPLPRREELHHCPLDGKTYIIPTEPEPPLYQPFYAAIACRGCGRRLYDDNGNKIKLPWWQFWRWGC